MNSHSLAELRSTFSALDAHESGDYTRLRQPNPLAEQVIAARKPRVRTIEKGGVECDRPQRQFSPAARFHSEISAGIDRAQLIKPRFDLVGLMGLDRVYGNNGRPPVPFRLGSWGYTMDELRAEERGRLKITEKQQRLFDAEYQQALDLAEYGGQPSAAVVFHCEEWTEPDGALACPVPFGLSARRIVRLVVLTSCVCFWCADRSRTLLDDYLLVSCHPTLRVFPTCPACRQGFDQDTEYSRLDWHDRSDRWFSEVGGPSDEWI